MPVSIGVFKRSNLTFKFSICYIVTWLFVKTGVITVPKLLHASLSYFTLTGNKNLSNPVPLLNKGQCKPSFNNLTLCHNESKTKA